MKKILNSDSKGFSEKLNDYILNNRSTNLDVSEKVKIIISIRKLDLKISMKLLKLPIFTLINIHLLFLLSVNIKN